MDPYVERARKWLREECTSRDARATLVWMDEHPGAIPRWVRKQIGGPYGIAKACVVCAKPAHHYVGMAGYCREHRDIASRHLKLTKTKIAEGHSDRINFNKGWPNLPSLSGSIDKKERERARRRA